VRLGSWGHDLLDLLLPAGCAACRAWMPGGRAAPVLCGRCASRLREAPWPRCPRCHFPRGARRVEAPDCLECRDWPAALTRARHAYVLASPAVDLVHALKYEGWRDLAESMGAAVAALVEDRPAAPSPRGPAPRTLVVPVPTTAARLRRRGYNQAELLARRVGVLRGLRTVPAITRAGGGDSQTSLAPSERRENVRGAFRPVHGVASQVAESDVLLVDDVLTTGATAAEASLALASMGAASVTLLTYARALPNARRGPA